MSSAACSGGGVCLHHHQHTGGGISHPPIPTHLHAVTTHKQLLVVVQGAGCPLIPLFPSVSLSPSHACTTHVAPLSTP